LNSDKPVAHFENRLRIIRSIIEAYDFSMPLHHFLKKYFAANRQFGSGDRRLYRSWCYAWFRTGDSLKFCDFYERLLLSYYLVHGLDSDFARSLISFCNQVISNDHPGLNERISLVCSKYPRFSLINIIPTEIDFSDGIEQTEFARSLLQQPSVFIRLNSGFQQKAIETLKDAGVKLEADNDLPECIKLPPETNLTTFQTKEKLWEIQDRTSQLISSKIPAHTGEHWWDCCCGAGGKSLALINRVPGVMLTASDKRETVLDNFRERLGRNRSMVKIETIDLETSVPFPDGTLFDGIIADIPCTGSGTWSRNPENITGLNTASVEEYVTLQRIILNTIFPFLKPGGKLIYITCSVLKAENEWQCEWIREKTGWNQDEQQLLNGISYNSDSMFYATFSQPVEN
jgi:16S rRNA (cytosine967-C5)-methyltransferase